MGLLSYVMQKYYSEGQIDGLLNKAELYLKTNFSPMDLIKKKYFLDKIGLFVKNNSKFFLEFESGFDNETKSTSISTSDFWNGTLQKNSWICFENDELVSVLQLLSNKDKNDIKKIYVKKLSDKYILFLPVYNNNENISKNLNEIEKDIIYFIKNEIIDEKIIHSLMSNKIATLLLISDKEKKLFNDIKQTVNNSDIIVQDENNIKLVLFTEDEIDIELYKYQLLITLKNIYPESKQSDIEIKFVGICSTLNDIKNFICKD
ncbi:MAG: hypothetical protein GX220_07150 [Treponema sp.]|nr:hypothetical protein [Treponema sp.]